MKRPLRGTSEAEAEEYLVSAFSVCSGFELLVLTTAEAESRDALREGLVVEGAEISVVEPSVEAVVHAPRVGPEVQGHRTLVRWFQAEEGADEACWRELAVALNRSRERLRDEHRYLWVLAGPLSLRQIMTLHAQDIYSGAYKAPHVSAHAGAEISWLHLSDLWLSKGEGQVPRQGGDFRRSVDDLFLPDLQRELDIFEASPDMVLVSGDLGFSGQAEDYAEVDRFIDRLLNTLERRSGARPLLLTVPGNHDVSRPRDQVDRAPFEMRDQLWERRDATLVEPLFANYLAWAQRRMIEKWSVDQIGMEPGALYTRSVVRSHFPGDYSVIVEKDDLRVGIVGLNTAWAQFAYDAASRGILLPFEQFHAALGEGGLSRLDGMHQCLLLTHHGPDSLSERSREILERRVYSLEPLVGHIHGHSHAEDKEESSLALPGYPLFDLNPYIEASRSGYSIARIKHGGSIESRRRVLVTIAARGAWRFGAATERKISAETMAPEVSSWWTQSRAKYFRKLESSYGMISLRGLGSRVGVPLELEDLHVPLHAIIDLSVERGQSPDAGQKSADLSEDRRTIALIDAFREARTFGRRGVVLLGDPGSGKTMQLQRLLLKVIRHGPESIGLPEGTIPIFVSLRNLRNRQGGLAGLIEDELSDPSLDLSLERGQELLRHGRLLFLLDGLDEVADADEQVEVGRWITRTRAAVPESYFVVSCRYAGYTPNVRLDRSFVELHIPPLSRDQVQKFVTHWYLAVELGLASDPQEATIVADERARDLLERLSAPEMRSARIYELTHSPLLLASICLVHRNYGKLPLARVDLYEQIIEMLLQLPVTFLAHQAIRVLQPVALWLHEQKGRTRATSGELSVIVEEALSSLRLSLEADDFLRVIRDESGLLIGRGVDAYGFSHLGFQEYLAARALRGNVLENPGVSRDLADHFEDSWWQEVILLMLGLDSPAVFEVFMREVVQHPGFVDWSDSTMMHVCLKEAVGVSPRPFIELITEPHRPADEEQAARQLAALRLLARAMPDALMEIEDSLKTHPIPSIKNWWREHQGGTSET